MRTNLPVTNVEYPIEDGSMIVSKTDRKGKIAYFNRAFEERMQLQLRQFLDTVRAA